MVINVELVRRLIETQFPQYAALPLKAVQPGGWDTARVGKPVYESDAVVSSWSFLFTAIMPRLDGNPT